MKLATCTLLVLLLGPSGQEAPEDPFPPSREGLTIPGGPGEDQWTALDLLIEYGRVTDQSIQYTRETQGLLQNTGIHLTAGVQVPPENVHSVVEALLFRNDYVVRIVHENDPRILNVVNLNTGARKDLRQDAIVVRPDQLDVYAKHPAILVTTTLTLEHLDVRTLSNSMRTMLTDANTQNIIPVGSSNSLVLMGFGRQVAALADLLTYVNAEAAKMPPPQGR